MTPYLFDDVSINATEQDKAVVRSARRLLLEVLKIPAAPLEHAVQIAHEGDWQLQGDPPEVFAALGVTRQALRMLWHLRCNLDAAMLPEARL
ncbi:MAG TPA: hypothetical protein PKG77_22535 [Phycisphaerae bacterium]|nr:hypothetical protein [Phycisphaerae bacterium]HQL73928.1 hypothetical protein [Phycisphaerae bacterium]